MQTGISVRTVLFRNEKICYTLERKKVKNLNLRIRADGSVYVSANSHITLNQIDNFVASKGEFIRSAQQKFEKRVQNRPKELQYISGEEIHILGQNLVLQVEQGMKETVYAEGRYLKIEVRDPKDSSRKQELLNQYLGQLCRTVYSDIIEELYPIFKTMNVPKPQLRIKTMKSRWGSCLVQKGIITLNTRMISSPRSCIVFVAMHEYCHFIYADHSKNFYALLTRLLPDWKEQKILLEKTAWQ